MNLIFLAINVNYNQLSLVKCILHFKLKYIIIVMDKILKQTFNIHV